MLIGSHRFLCNIEQDGLFSDFHQRTELGATCSWYKCMCCGIMYLVVFLCNLRCSSSRSFISYTLLNMLMISPFCSNLDLVFILVGYSIDLQITFYCYRQCYGLQSMLNIYIYIYIYSFWEKVERLRNDLYCVEWDVKLYYNITGKKWNIRFNPGKTQCIAFGSQAP